MLDIKFIRENAAAIKEAAKNKNIKIDIDELLQVDKDRCELLAKINDLRTARNELAGSAKAQRPTEEQIAKGRALKEEIANLENKLSSTEQSYFDLMSKVPTVPAADTPIGKDDSENVEIYKWGEVKKFDFEPKTHIDLAKNLDIVDFDRGTKVAGYRGYYVKGDAVLLQMGFLMYALDKLRQRGFNLFIPPTLIREYALFGSGYFSGRAYNPEVDEIYKVENKEKLHDGSIAKDDKFLVGTAEPSLLAYYSDEVLDESELPLKMAGFSQCYRSEIGSYGKDTKGIYRVHEFMKVEQVVICKADQEEADKLQQEMVAISKEIHQDLGIPYRMLRICTGDMSAGKYKMFDIEAWMPGLNKYGETGSASNFVDWQSRRLNVKYKTADGEKKFVYMLNNTALPSPRILIAILENNQQADGSIIVPEVLRKYVGKDVIGKK